MNVKPPPQGIGLSFCGLSQSALIRQLCKGKAPKPQPQKEFWELLKALYDIHNSFQKCSKYESSALEICKEMSAWSSIYRRWDNGYNFSTSPYFKEELRKLDELSEQVRYMSKYGIETFDDLYADRDRLRGEMDKLVAYRTKLQNKIRRASPAEKETLRREKSGVTERITELRKQLKLNKGIEERSIKIQEKTDLLYANEYRAKEEIQNKNGVIRIW